MMEKQSNWSPNRNEAIKALIRQTISAAGDIAPDKLPHHVRTTLQGQIEGDVDIKAIVTEILIEEGRKGQ